MKTRFLRDIEVSEVGKALEPSLEKIKDNHKKLMSLGERNAFCRGFSFAVRLMFDAMSGKIRSTNFTPNSPQNGGLFFYRKRKNRTEQPKNGLSMRFFLGAENLRLLSLSVSARFMWRGEWERFAWLSP